MRTLWAVIIAGLVLLASATGAVTVAGDIGPGQNGAVPLAIQIAGDIGPGQNG
ncbi:MAG TPA: hypothetical protein VNN19_01370 [bacterium]|nr:hypothetical protein [bacterium]